MTFVVVAAEKMLFIYAFLCLIRFIHCREDIREVKKYMESSMIPLADSLL